MGGIALYGVSTLRRVIRGGVGFERARTRQTTVVVRRRVGSVLSHFVCLNAQPIVISLSRGTRRVHRHRLHHTVKGLPSLGRRRQQIVRRVARVLIEGVLHRPVACLRRRTKARGRDTNGDTMRALFDLSVKGKGTIREWSYGHRREGFTNALTNEVYRRAS